MRSRRRRIQTASYHFHPVARGTHPGKSDWLSESAATASRHHIPWMERMMELEKWREAKMRSASGRRQSTNFGSLNFASLNFASLNFASLNFASLFPLPSDQWHPRSRLCFSTVRRLIPNRIGFSRAKYFSPEESAVAVMARKHSFHRNRGDFRCDGGSLSEDH